jgi:hypothetical protein
MIHCGLNKSSAVWVAGWGNLVEFYVSIIQCVYIAENKNPEFCGILCVNIRLFFLAKKKNNRMFCICLHSTPSSSLETGSLNLAVPSKKE